MLANQGRFQNDHFPSIVNSSRLKFYFYMEEGPGYRHELSFETEHRLPDQISGSRALAKLQGLKNLVIYIIIRISKRVEWVHKASTQSIYDETQRRTSRWTFSFSSQRYIVALHSCFKH